MTTSTAPSRHRSWSQFCRYVLTGIWNTAFSYGSFALLTNLLDRFVPQSYLLASLISSFLSITVSFLGYKWFVFKTKGNYFREWCKCVAVYGGGIALGFVLLPILVFVIRHKFGYQHQAPYIAGALLPLITVTFTFFGHKHISFRQKPSEARDN